MAMFGQNSSKWGDALMNIGALMTDVGQGQGPQYTMALAKQRKDRQLLEQQMAARQQLAGLFGGTAMGSGQGPGPNIRDPRVQQALLNAEAAGVDVDTALKLIEMSRPNVQFAPDETAVDVNDPANVGKSFASSRYENGWRVTPNDANAPSFLPKIPDATIPDGRGGVIPVAGAAEAMARQAGMIAGAEAAEKAPYDFINVPTASGAPRVMSKSNAMGGDFVGQAPADKIRTETAARSQADAAAALPQSVQTAQNALDVIQQIRTHPGFNSRVGLAAVVPALPNTAGKDFDVLVEQAKGQVFLQAFQALKGGGQITEREGQAAAQAVARLNQAQTKAGFTKALDDLEKVIRAGVERSQQKAGQSKPQVSREQALEELRRRGLVK